MSRRSLRRVVVVVVCTSFIVATPPAVAFLASVAVRPGVSTDRLALAVSLLAVVVGLRPVTKASQSVAERLLPTGPEPGAVLAEFSAAISRLPATSDGVVQLARIVCDVMGAPAARIVVGESGEPREEMWPEGAAGPWSKGVVVAQGGERLGSIDFLARTELADDMLAEIASRSASFFRTVGLVSALQRQVDELERQSAELRDARRRIVVSADEERRRLERNLHDGAQQQLTALLIQLGVAEAIVERAPERLPFLAAELAVAAEDIANAVSDLGQGADPRLLREKGLASALLVHAARLPLPVDVAVEDVGRHASDVEATVYYSCLEAIQNAVKHGRPQRIGLGLRSEDDAVVFRVVDDGVGFDPAAAPRGGLQNLTDRLAAMGGRLDVTSSPGAGTEVIGRVTIGGRVAEQV